MPTTVRQGIDVLEAEGFDILKGRRIGLITNYSFVTKDMRRGVEAILHAGVEVTRIFTPEHGMFGLPDGAACNDAVYPGLGIPMTSLYGKRKKPTPADYDGIDLLVYDIQDVGLRYYTFIYTLAYCLETAAEVRKAFVVLDRVNPLGGRVYGPRISQELESFVGGYFLPTAYGLTPGELARYVAKLKRLEIDLEVVPLKGWNRESFDETDLLWNVPSPGLPTFAATLCYAGMCLLEATTLSEGRGTPTPFQYVGAPWLDSDGLYDCLRKRFPALTMRKREFIPRFGKHADQLCFGIEFFPKREDDFFVVTIEIMAFAKKHGEFEISEYLDRLSGDPELRKVLTSKEPFDVACWQGSREEYLSFISDILLYGSVFH